MISTTDRAWGPDRVAAAWTMYDAHVGRLRVLPLRVMCVAPTPFPTPLPTPIPTPVPSPRTPAPTPSKWIVVPQPGGQRAKLVLRTKPPTPAPAPAPTPAPTMPTPPPPPTPEPTYNPWRRRLVS